MTERNLFLTSAECETYFHNYVLMSGLEVKYQQLGICCWSFLFSFKLQISKENRRSEIYLIQHFVTPGGRFENKQQQSKKYSIKTLSFGEIDMSDQVITVLICCTSQI